MRVRSDQGACVKCKRSTKRAHLQATRTARAWVAQRPACDASAIRRVWRSNRLLPQRPEWKSRNCFPCEASRHHLPFTAWRLTDNPSSPAQSAEPEGQSQTHTHAPHSRRRLEAVAAGRPDMSGSRGNGGLRWSKGGLRWLAVMALLDAVTCWHAWLGQEALPTLAGTGATLRKEAAHAMYVRIGTMIGVGGRRA